MFLFRILTGIFLTTIFFSCTQNKPLLILVPGDKSGIHFNNKIIENDSINPLDIVNIYNGGGVGVGDFNHDGLQDLYFAGNRVPNKLYLNKGHFQFDDVTEAAKVDGNGEWCRGVSVVDINNDGWPDIYVCTTLLSNPEKRKNLLYINGGVDKAGVPQFHEMAEDYGLADTVQSTMAEFFDYDNDGDLDVYITVNEILNEINPATYRPKITDGSFPSTGRLYRNDWDVLKKHPVFTNVTKEAGVTIEGYGHSATIADINRDGWKDIYVTNDFLSNDLLYINNHDGTFTDKAAEYFKHTSANGMGQDVIDINNDGLSDVIELDMSPEDNYRKKMMMGAGSYLTYQNNDRFGYQYQYVRNSLQLNRGPRVTNSDSIGDPIFSDVGFYAGIAQTDWSWAPLVTDFDNDGFRDVIITNGFPKDVTDHDFTNFRQGAASVASKEYLLSQIPVVKIHNYAFRNNGDVTFNDVTDSWGMTIPSFSNGAVYVDLDNDGDMDMVVNNINDEAFVYKNTLMDSKAGDKLHYLSVSLTGDSLNRDGLGTWIDLYYQGKTQAYEETPYRGYLSTVQKEPHFGLGDVSVVDSVIIKWPNGKMQVLSKVRVDQLLKVNSKDAKLNYTWDQAAIDKNVVFTDITDSLNLRYHQHQNDFIDFNIQKLLPHKFTEYGPALAAGDVNGDGIDDIVIGGNSSQVASVLLQRSSGEFLEKLLPKSATATSFQAIDMGISLFDADGDGDLDIYIAGGGYEAPENTETYKDRLYLNDGKGNFTIDTTALPQNFTSKSCVRAADYDHDGDLDLFIAGRVDPWKYPQPVSSFIYRNDSKDGIVKFTDVTSTVAPGLNKIGMVCDAVWTDFDNDGWIDLVLAGEWMPVTFIKNEKGIFKNISATTGINNKIGWWTSIVPGDFDNDGKMDFIAGNLGLNSYYKASDQYPVRIYGKDFDNNDSYDAIPTIYLRASQTDTTKKEFPVHVRDDMTKQIISFRAKYQNYKSYASAPFNEMFKPEEMKNALILKANDFENSYIKNMGGGKFEMVALPATAQYSCMNGMLSEDFDGDGNLDLLINGNDYSTEVSVGRYDACNGILLKGNGKGGFTPESILQSGWFIPGNGKALIKIKNPSGKVLVAASQNKGPIKIYAVRADISTIDLKPNDASAKIVYKNGKSRLINIDYGSSFLSQSGRFLNIDNNVVSVEIKDSKGNKRTVKR